jgi:RNA polymerase sigma factor (sigma-70 family)
VSAMPTAAPPRAPAPGNDAPAAAAASAVAATQRLYERHQRRILAYCMSRLRNIQESEDAVQNTFVYAFKLLERGVVPEAELPWLFTIAHNVCRSRRRALWRRGRLETPTSLDAFEDVIGSPDNGAGHGLTGLSEALASIPETQRRALLLREWHGLSYAEIGATLSLSQSAVETLLFRARRSLAKQLASTYDRVAVMLNGFVLLRFARRLARTGIGAKATAAVVVAGAVAGAGIPLEHNLRHQPPSAPQVSAIVPVPAAQPAANRVLRRARQLVHFASTAAGTPRRTGLEAATAHFGKAGPQIVEQPSRTPAPVAQPSSESVPTPPTRERQGADAKGPQGRLRPSQPLDQTAEQATSALSTVVAQASQTAGQTASQTSETASQAVQQTESVVSTVVSSVTPPPSNATTGGTTSSPPAPAAAVQQTVTNAGKTASNAVSQLLGRGREGP